MNKNNNRNIEARLHPNRTKQLLIDPNYGNENVPLENLSIECDLSVYERSRSFIGVENDDQGNKTKLIGQIKEQNVPFNQGEKFEDGFSFTTNYTEVSDIDYDGKETLGITSVHVDYNSSYMPLITIELTDVKGKLFQMGKKGPYSPFFNFPYPLFELKIKGYFGKPVVYLLHMTKFNSKMNSENGNFQITCEFNGYTYAYLSDMLLGYLKAVPYTTIGREIVDEKRYNDPEFVSFIELYEYANKLYTKIEEFKKNDKELQALALAQGIGDSMASIKSKLLSRIKSLNGRDKNFSVTTESDLLFVRHTTSTEQEKSHLDLFTEFVSENMLSDVTEHNNLAKNSKYTLSEELYDIDNSTESNMVVKLLYKSIFLDSDDNIRTQYYGDKDILKDREFFLRIANIVKRISSEIGDDYFDVVILTDNLNEIDNKLSLLQDEIKNSESIKQDSVFDDLSKLSIIKEDGSERTFDFNIQNYTKVLADHVDILMETIKRTDRYAEANSSRNFELLEGANSLYDINSDDLVDKVYGFPDYRKRQGNATNPQNVLTDTWIGTDYPDIDEVIFIKELHQGLIDSKRDEDIFTTRLDEINSQWCGINPFDSMLFTEGNNPWGSVANTTGADGEILRLLIMRAVTFLSLTVRTPHPKEIKAMARLEANNLFRVILNADVKNFLSDIGNDHKDISNRIRLLANKSNEKNSNSFSLVNQDKIISNEKRYTDGYFSILDSEQPTSYENYVYIGGHVNSENIEEVFTDDEIQSGIRYFLPLYFKDNKNNFKGETLNMVSNDTRISMREEGNIFFGDYMGNHLTGNDKPDVGATYIQIHDPEFFSEKYDDSSYAQSIIEAENIENNKAWEYEDVKGSKFTKINYNGRYGSNEFRKYTRNGKPYDFYNYFYKDESIVDSHPELVFRLADTQQLGRDLNFTSYKYSLFGSEFYYVQNDFGRAYLFLRSIHFKIRMANIFNEEILNLFDKKAATIQVPYSWVLLIGAILYRYDNEILIGEQNGVSTLPTPFGIGDNTEFIRNQSANIPHAYLKPGKTVSTYERDMDVVLDKLPDSVKNIFKKEFTDWVEEGGFKPIQDQLEIYKDGKLPDINTLSSYFINLDVDKENSLDNSELFKPGAVSNYDWIKPIKKDGEGNKITTSNVGQRTDKGSILNFELKLKDEFGAQVLSDFLKEKKYIVNATWRIWANDLDGWFTDDRIEGDTYPLTFSTDNLNGYLTAFIIEFSKLVDNFNDDERRSRQIFGSNNLEEIYLTMYKNIKSINDKWITGENYKVRSSFDNLIETFKFIDRGYNDIGEAFKLNPMDVTNLLTSNYNHSFYSHISKILNKNNFDFIPMPNYVDLRSEGSMKDLFTTNGYNSDVPSSEPSFVCMYIGEKSNRLDVGDNFNGDGINFGDETELPDDFNTVPAILVKYGDQNQSIFKNLNLDQNEYSETNESLMTTDQIATSYNNINAIGQNIFDVYNNRAYNAEVEMLGNAMMQPFLYFQLDNVPMFRGGYVITKVTHDITPNHMTTKFKGNRVKYVKTKLLDKDTVFYNMIGSLSDIRVGESTLSDLPKEKTSGTENTNEEVSKSSPLPQITANMTDSELYKRAYIPKKNIDNSLFDRESNTIKNGIKMTFTEIFKEVEKLTGVPELTLRIMSVMESSVGKPNRFYVNGKNSIGYVGLMQFGYTAATDLQTRLNIDNSLFSIPDINDYTFYSAVDRTNKKLLKPEKWHSGTDSQNNKDTNSWFDDFISTYASAILAQDNIRRLGSSLENVVDVYLTHQQGLGGVKTILREPNNELIENGKNNMPPNLPKSSIKYNQQWYIGWSAHVEASAKVVDKNYKLIVGKDVDGIV